MAITRVGSTAAVVNTSAPSGMLAPYAGSAAPSGWLLCDGAAVSRSTYASLFSAIGTTYGAGNGSTTFNLPDMRGRVAVGKNAGTFAALGGTGGAEAVTLTAAQSGVPAHGHGASGSSGSVSGHSHGGTITSSSAGGHQHYYNRPNFSSITAANGGGTSVMSPTVTFSNINTTDSSPVPAHTHTVTLSSDGSHSHSIGVSVANNAAADASAAHANLQPYIVLNWIIKE